MTIKRVKAPTAAAAVAKMITFALEKETTGALRYVETDDKGTPINLKGPSGMDAATVGTLYVRKAALNGVIPQSISISLSYSA